MNYIINPRIIYWINVLDGLQTIAIISLVLGSIAAFVLFIIGLIDLQDMDDEERKRFKTSFRISVPVFLFGLLGTIFIPGKETLLGMLIAKTATVENAEWTVDAVKQAIDYIVNAIQTLK